MDGARFNQTGRQAAGSLLFRRSASPPSPPPPPPIQGPRVLSLPRCRHVAAWGMSGAPSTARPSGIFLFLAPPRARCRDCRSCYRRRVCGQEGRRGVSPAPRLIVGTAAMTFGERDGRGWGLGKGKKWSLSQAQNSCFSQVGLVGELVFAPLRSISRAVETRQAIRSRSRIGPCHIETLVPRGIHPFMGWLWGASLTPPSRNPLRPVACPFLRD